MEREFKVPVVTEISWEEYMYLRRKLENPSLGKLALVEVEHEPIAA